MTETARIHLSVPVIEGNAWTYVKECLDTGWISSAGKFVGDFEQAIAGLAGAPYAVATVNGTAALQIALLVAGVEAGQGVIAPNLTFVASLNAISYLNAVPVLIDAEADGWQMDLDLLEDYLANSCERVEQGVRSPEGLIITTILPVHVLGNIGHVRRLMALAEQYGLTVVEDSTEALGSTYEGQSAGTFGRLGTFSFNGNKILSTGGGGMIVTGDEQLARRAKHLTTTAKTRPDEYFHDEVGYNFRLVNLLAAVGLSQAEVFPDTLATRRRIEGHYRQALAGVGDITFARVLPDVNPNGWLTTFRTRHMRELLASLTQAAIECRPLWVPMNQLPMFANCPFIGEQNVSGQLYESCISIPSSGNLTAEQGERVIDHIKHFYEQQA
ncbi:MAG: aminotransferase class I/II-fold pyridoxal phosphate-dependent enzyme [Burkholderiaceae bacterium]